MTEPLRVAHVGMYGKNIGDSLALLGARRTVEACVDRPVKFTAVDMYPLCFGGQKECNQRLKAAKEESDVLLFGGGGLIESWEYQGAPYVCKLPFQSEVFRWLTIAILCLGLGVNTWRPFHDFSAEARRGIESMLRCVRLVTLRNDGSAEKLREILGHEAGAYVGPAMAYAALHDLPIAEPGDKVLFQVAWNTSPLLNVGRFLSGAAGLRKALPPDRWLLPHTTKEYSCDFAGQWLMPKADLIAGLKLDAVRDWIARWYRGRYVIAMRGHGAMCSVLRGVPGIYLSTQDKVRDFARLNGFADWCVDTAEDDWLARFQDMIARIAEDGDYRARWFAAREAFLAREAAAYEALKARVRDALRDL